VNTRTTSRQDPEQQDAKTGFFQETRYVVKALLKGMFRSRKKDTEIVLPPIEPSRHFFVRYDTVVIACFYTIGIALTGILQPASETDAILGAFLNVFEIAHLPSVLLPAVFMLIFGPALWIIAVPLVNYAAYALGQFLEFRALRAPKTYVRGQIVFVIVCALCAVAFGWRMDVLMEDLAPARHSFHNSSQWEDEKFIRRYNPAITPNELVKVEAPTLTIPKNHPRLGGATGIYPVYAAAAAAIYENIYSPAQWNELVQVSGTPAAYEGLINGNFDMIFALHPSEEQIAKAKEKGIEFQLTPIGREAFVFFVNTANPVSGLTSEQLRAIYTKRVTRWEQVGGADAKILPFQRPKNSGSQTTMERQFMRGEPMAKPLREEVHSGMGSIVQGVAEYQNSATAIGYSFRFFLTNMTGIKGVKLLSLDGIFPDAASIRSGRYPYATPVYIVTTSRAPDLPEVKALLAWFQSEQGRQLIESSGYIAPQ
jgi:phosphate transport system substrate-binding protein